MNDMLIPKRVRVRDKPWREYVATMPCRVCGSREGVQAAHIGHTSLSAKDDDDAIMPLCRIHHDQLDGRDIRNSEGGKEFWLVKHIIRPELESAYRSWKQGI
jgi:hypothetical protein